mgnify:CR=1 FL=1
MSKQDDDSEIEDYGYAEEEQAYGVVAGILILAFATYGLMHNNVPFISRSGFMHVSFHGWSAWVLFTAYVILFAASILSFFNFMNRKYRSWIYPKEKYLRLKSINKFMFILAAILMMTCLLQKWIKWVD